MALAKHNLVFLVILIPIAIFTVLFYFFDWDIAIASQFWNSTDKWFLGDLQPWAFFRDWLEKPIVVVAAIALLLFLISFLKLKDSSKFFRVVTKLKAIRLELLFIVLVIVIGDGLIVNAILKEFWGRPRPRDILQFGGDYAYIPLWTFGPAGDNSSFTCGHCAAAWSFIVFGFLFLHRNRVKAALAFIGVGIYGTLMSITRMVQGGHFLSDAMWSLFILYLVAFAFYYWILKIPTRYQIPEGSSGRSNLATSTPSLNTNT